MTLALPTTLPVSQRFAGAAEAEPNGWFVNAKDGRPLKASRTAIAGWIKHVDFHQGVDQYGAAGSNLLALEAGKVVEVNRTLGHVVVQIRGQANSRYSIDHCSSILAAVGASIAKGQHIAEMGKLGNATGVHSHTQIMFREKGPDGVTRWIQYDPARFYPPRTFRFGTYYRAAQVAKGTCDRDGYLYGGSNLYDDRIYPIRAITINDGANVRKRTDRTSDVVLLTSSVTPASQVNEIPGGEYELGGVTATLWAKVKVKLPNGTLATGYVAKPLIKV